MGDAIDKQLLFNSLLRNSRKSKKGNSSRNIHKSSKCTTTAEAQVGILLHPKNLGRIDMTVNFPSLISMDTSG